MQIRTILGLLAATLLLAVPPTTAYAPYPPGQCEGSGGVVYGICTPTPEDCLDLGVLPVVDFVLACASILVTDDLLFTVDRAPAFATWFAEALACNYIYSGFTFC